MIRPRSKIHAGKFDGIVSRRRDQKDARDNKLLISLDGYFSGEWFVAPNPRDKISNGNDQQS
jgi:hypothetical protein